MKRAFQLSLVTILLQACAAGALAADKVDFNRDVLPILSANCFRCHGPDQGARKAELRLDVRDVAVAKKKVITPNKSDSSELIERITSDDDDVRMPPPKAGGKLTAEQIQTLRNWIDQGAPYAEHWAFIAPVPPEIPAVADEAWAKSPVDRFVLAKLEHEQQKPAPQASREVLIRRATLDLIGLPPSPQEVEDFVNDKSPDAYQHLVDRLLDSPHYGERWGRHWLDVARYADSGGFETDIFNGHAWRFRDYVIRAFNADKPFDQFIREQVAGDELYPGNADALLATSFFTIGPVLQESGMVPGKLEYDQMTDAADTTGSAFLGLTMGCARCHDHKYDPISQREYYGLQAVFADSDQFDLKPDGSVLRGRAAIKNTLQEFEVEQLKQRVRHETETAQRDDDLRKIGDYYIAKASGGTGKRMKRASSGSPELQAALEKYREAVAKHATEDMDVSDAVVAERQKELDELLVDVGRRALDTEPQESQARQAFHALSIDTDIREFLLELGKKTADAQNADKSEKATQPDQKSVADDKVDRRLTSGEKHLEDASEIPERVLSHRDKPVAVHILAHGDLDQPGDAVEPCVPAKIAADQDLRKIPDDQRRAALANWLASERNPLTARVIVNRIWQWHFGQAIVRTPNDFGLRGEPPTHPELLDWLAVDFMEHGWSIKHLNRVIMESAAYQMASTADAATLASDPENRLLTHFQPHRVEAEVVWDSVRAVAGTLDLTMYGLPIAPPLDDQEQIGNFRKWPTSLPDEANRRALYILVRRSFRFPTLGAFDLPDNISSCAQRDITTIPNQALTMLNNRTFKEQASAFAARLLHETENTPGAIAELAWKYAYGRSIQPDERQRIVEFIKSHQADTNVDSPEALKPAVEELCMALFNTNEFIYTP